LTDTTTWVAGAIREAREQRGWPQAELARRLEVTQTAVSYWESGKRSPGVDDLLELAEVLEVPIETFFPGERTKRPVTAVLRATVARLADSDLEEAIEELLDDAEHSVMPSTELRVGASAPSHAANELLEKASVDVPPVDVEALAARCGVLVLRRMFPDSLSGLVFAFSNAAVIGVNGRHHPNRQRFSIAHELGHYLLGHHRRSSGYEQRFHIDTAEGTAPGFDWDAEQPANEFAAEVLMPRRLLAAAFEKTPKPALLAARFEVSELAMGYRLVNLGLR
jgi:Zn-dependent peptidase ImmA (M78 family)/DNA-binding XRE family transcriptional regulator